MSVHPRLKTLVLTLLNTNVNFRLRTCKRVLSHFGLPIRSDFLGLAIETIKSSIVSAIPLEKLHGCALRISKEKRLGDGRVGIK